MARLPNVGEDRFAWGDILNEYLTVSHNEDGTLKTQDTLPVNGVEGSTLYSRFVGSTESGPPTDGVYAAGDFVVDRSGRMWVCFTGGTPGNWMDTGSGRLLGMAEITAAQTSASGTAEAFSPALQLIDLDLSGRPIRVEIVAEGANSTANNGSRITVIDHQSNYLLISTATSATANAVVNLSKSRVYTPPAGLRSFYALKHRHGASGTATFGPVSPVIQLIVTEL